MGPFEINGFVLVVLDDSNLDFSALSFIILPSRSYFLRYCRNASRKMSIHKLMIYKELFSICILCFNINKIDQVSIFMYNK